MPPYLKVEAGLDEKMAERKLDIFLLFIEIKMLTKREIRRDIYKFDTRKV